MSIALFYGSSGGVTAEAAEKIAGAFRAQTGLELPLFDVAQELLDQPRVLLLRLCGAAPL